MLGAERCDLLPDKRFAPHVRHVVVNAINFMQPIEPRSRPGLIAPQAIEIVIADAIARQLRDREHRRHGTDDLARQKLGAGTYTEVAGGG
jgi:hypothetical protein